MISATYSKADCIKMMRMISQKKIQILRTNTSWPKEYDKKYGVDAFYFFTEGGHLFVRTKVGNTTEFFHDIFFDSFWGPKVSITVSFMAYNVLAALSKQRKMPYLKSLLFKVHHFTPAPPNSIILEK